MAVATVVVAAAVVAVYLLALGSASSVTIDLVSQVKTVEAARDNALRLYETDGSVFYLDDASSIGEKESPEDTEDRSRVIGTETGQIGFILPTGSSLPRASDRDVVAPSQTAPEGK